MLVCISGITRLILTAKYEQIRRPKTCELTVGVVMTDCSQSVQKPS